jgi:hypothetical protein
VFGAPLDFRVSFEAFREAIIGDLHDPRWVQWVPILLVLAMVLAAARISMRISKAARRWCCWGALR